MTSLPPLYSGWMTELFGEGAEPDEPRATCLSCPMVDRPGQPRLEVAFNAEHKCCTFQPTLPNFLAGAILRGTDEVGEWSRRMLRQRIRQRFAVTPVAIEKSPVYGALYELAAVAGPAFGQAKGLRCPYYVDRDGGLCGVWRSRPAICATWFCKHERGPLGRLYARAVEALFREAEHALKYWSLREIDMPLEGIAELWLRETDRENPLRPLDADAMNGTIGDAAYRELWGAAAGREEEVYAACAERVATLTAADVRRIAGYRLENVLTVVQVLRARMVDDTLPERARVNSTALVQLGRTPGTARVRHEFVKYDWLEVPTALIDELARFDRAPVRQVIAELAGAGVAVDEKLVRSLMDWGVLAPPG
jgi:hypothetical protein